MANKKKRARAKSKPKFYTHPIKLHQTHMDQLRMAAEDSDTNVANFVRGLVLKAVARAGYKVDSKLEYTRKRPYNRAA